MINVGDIVKPKPDHMMRGVDYGYGVVLDFYEDEYGTVYYEVAWSGADTTWWSENEVEVISESR